MLNKNDPLIGAVQEVMRKNQADRDAVKAVNEKFGVVDRRALPHEQQANWDAAYAKVLSEGVQSLNEEMSEKQKKLAKVGNKAGLGGSPTEIDAPDLKGARMGHAKHIEEEQLDERNKENKKAKDAFVKRVGNAARKSGDPKHLTNVGTGMRTSVANKIRGRELTQGKNRVDEEQLDEVLDTSKKRMDYGIKAIGSYVKASLTGDENTKRKRLAGNKNYKKKVAQAGEKQAMDSYREKKSGEILRDMGRKTGLGQHYDKIFKEEHLEEKAVSKAQHRFFGLVRGIQKGEAKGSAEATKAAKSMSVKSVRDYAKTKEKGLPEKKD